MRSCCTNGKLFFYFIFMLTVVMSDSDYSDTDTEMTPPTPLTMQELEVVRCLREGVMDRSAFAAINMRKFINTIFTFYMLSKSGLHLAYINTRLCYPFPAGRRGRVLLETPMSLAILGGNLDIVRMLCTNEHYFPKKFDVYVSLQYGSSAILKMLLRMCRGLIYTMWHGMGAGMILARCAKSIYLYQFSRIGSFEEKVRTCYLLGVNFHCVQQHLCISTLTKFILAGASTSVLDIVSNTLTVVQLNHVDKHGKSALYYAIKDCRPETCNDSFGQRLYSRPCL